MKHQERCEDLWEFSVHIFDSVVITDIQQYVSHVSFNRVDARRLSLV